MVFNLRGGLENIAKKWVRRSLDTYVVRRPDEKEVVGFLTLRKRPGRSGGVTSESKRREAEGDGKVLETLSHTTRGEEDHLRKLH